MPTQVDPYAFQNAFSQQVQLGQQRRAYENQLAQQGVENQRNKLRDLYMGEQQLWAREDRATQQRQLAEQEDMERRVTLYRAAQSVVSAQDPIRQSHAVAPELQKLGLPTDLASLEGADPETVRGQAKQVMDQLAPFLPSQQPKDLQLETILGDDGKPRFVPREQAVGKQPWQKNDQPSSYEEFTLAQKDPEFAAFLKSRRGKGISITQPDGSVIQIGGEGGEVGPGDLSGPTKNKLQESLVQAADELDRLNSIGQAFDPKFLTIQGRALGAGLKLKDISGGLFGQMNPQEKDFLRRYSTFRAESGKNLSAILNRLSGAAISPAEGERLKKGIPNDEDSPTQFQAKYDASVKDVTRATMRANWALKNGIGVRSVEQLAQVMPLDAIDQVYEQRANQIWQELGGTPETKQRAIQQANQEFGLAR